MATITFDTLKLARKLEAVGFTREQAAGAAEALAESLGEISEVATKEDILRLEARIEANKAELLKWAFGGLVAQTGVIVALLKLLP